MVDCELLKGMKKRSQNQTTVYDDFYKIQYWQDKSYLSAMGPPMTHPSRSPITNKLAVSWLNKSPSFMISLSVTYPGALLKGCGDLCLRMLELGDEDGRESHWQASTETWQVGDHSSQELDMIIKLWTTKFSTKTHHPQWRPFWLHGFPCSSPEVSTAFVFVSPSHGK